MPRSEITKQLLAQSLKELMATSPLEKISVNDITEHAGVGRNTFYYHFQDKYDLVNQYFQIDAAHFLVERSSGSSWKSVLAGIEGYFRENKDFYSNALQYNGQNSLQEYIYNFIKTYLSRRLKECCPGMDKAETRFIVDFIAGGAVSVIDAWVREGMPDRDEERNAGILAIRSGDLMKVLMDNSAYSHIFSAFSYTAPMRQRKAEPVQ